MKRRTLTIGLAVLLAVLGTAAVLAYVRQANNRALEGVQAVTVLVAGKVIPSGTSASAAQSFDNIARRMPDGDERRHLEFLASCYHECEETRRALIEKMRRRAPVD